MGPARGRKHEMRVPKCPVMSSVFCPYEKPLVKGKLVKRYKRFLADVQLEDGSVVTAHCPNSGSMLGLKDEGMDVLILDSRAPARKLDWTLEFVRHASGHWIGVNTQRPNQIVEWAIENDRIPGLTAKQGMRREVKYGKNSRIDILLGEDEDDLRYVEVKNTTLYDGEFACFPDAVTARGAKHMVELADMVKEGHKATVVFLVNGGEPSKFRPEDAIDPAYGKAFREALEVGVEAIPLWTQGGPEGWVVKGVLKVDA